MRREPAGIGLDFTKGLPEGEQGGPQKIHIKVRYQAAYFPEPVFAKNGQNSLTHQVFLGLVPSDFPKSWGSCPWTLLRRGGGRPGEGLVQHVGVHLHVFLAPVACFWSILHFFLDKWCLCPLTLASFGLFCPPTTANFFGFCPQT